MRLAPLDRKVLRDLARLRWQVAAIALLIGCAVSVAVMALSARAALERAQMRFYAATQFADVFATLTHAPLQLGPRITSISGVRQADMRVVAVGLMRPPALVRPATVRLISLPPAEGGLNGILVTRGRLPDPARPEEVVGLQTFLEAAGLKVGDEAKAVIHGRELRLRIVGAALSPEFVYTPAPQSMMPDDAHQGVLWAPRARVEQIAGLEGAFNSLALSLEPGASGRAVSARLDSLLGPWGGRRAYLREDQVSHAFLEAELAELSRSAALIPPIFLLVAAGLVHLVVSRLVEAEREQIGLLKAFGYTDGEASRPYLRLAAGIGLLGAALGGLMGWAFTLGVLAQYRAYFRFPQLDMVFDVPAFAVGSALAIGAATIGAWRAAGQVSQLSPALAMQPRKPPVFRHGRVERWTRAAWIDEPSRMVFRRIARFPARSFLAVLGLAASLTLLIGTRFMFDAMGVIIDHTYFRTQRWTEAIAFQEPRAISALESVARLPGVVAAEPLRSVGARISSGQRREQVRIVGISSSARLTRPLDVAGRPVRPCPGEGVVISASLAGRLKVRPGMMVHLESLEGRRAEGERRVCGLIDDYSGYSVYEERRRLNRFLGEGELIDQAQLLVAADQRAAFYAEVARTPGIIGASSRDETVQAWRQALAQAFQTMLGVLVGFAGAIAFGVAYNTARIALSEQARDLATLQVLGFRPSDCAWVLAAEIVLLTLVAAPAGIWGGRLIAHGLATAYSREDVRIPDIVSLQSYGWSALAFFIAVALALALVLSRVWRLDLVSVLKTRE